MRHDPLTLPIASSTIANNSAPSGQGGGIFNEGATTSFSSSILADNSSGGNCMTSAGTITDGGFNDADDTTCFAAGLPNTNGTSSGEHVSIGTLSLAANGSIRA